MNDNFNVNDFLKKNNAIFEYLRDEDGFKIGVIIAVPGDNEPKIGYATFGDMSPDEIFSFQHPVRKVKHLVGHFPKFAKQLINIGADAKYVEKMEMPFLAVTGRTIIRDMTPDMRKKMLIKARRKANYNRAGFYSAWEGPTEVEERDERDSKKRTQKINSRSVDDINREKSSACFRKQVRKFEYRALRYFKYIPGYKEKTN